MRPLNSELFPPVPMDTAQAARSVFSQSVFRGSNFYLSIGDQVNSLFSGLPLEDSMGWIQKPIPTLATLYLITIFQFVEALPDPLAADALKMRVDWKYALHLPLNYSGLDALLFCQFRQRLLKDRTGKRIMQALLSRLSRVMELTGKQRSCLEFDRVVNDVCLFSRLEKIWETVRQAIEVLSTNQPQLLFGVSLPYWNIRYSHHRRNLNLRTGKGELVGLAQVIGADGLSLLKAISEADMPQLVNLPEVWALQQVWRNQFEWVDRELCWRKNACPHCHLVSKK